MSERTGPASAWLLYAGEKDDDAVTLFCFGAAGTGGSQFRAWNQRTPSWLRIVGVQLPGREERYREALVKDPHLLAARIGAEVAASGARRFAFFGHSFGALLAFETTRALAALGQAPLCLFAAARAAPQLPYAYRKSYLFSNERFADVLCGYGGLDRKTLDSQRFRDFYFPIVRSDLEANTEYQYRAGPPLAVPVTVLMGRDDKYCSAEEMLAWRDQTSAAFVSQVWKGGHFFFRDNMELLLETITAALEPARHAPADAEAAFLV
jgi:medium-chain acyl-[acyl-carrier-protein] hydrolase